MRASIIFLALLVVGLLCVCNAFALEPTLATSRRVAMQSSFFVPSQWNLRARAPLDAHLTVYVAVKRTADSLESMFELSDAVSTPSSPRYGDYLTLDQLHSLVKVDPGQLATVQEWLCTAAPSHQVLKSTPAQDLFSVRVSVGEATALFGCAFGVYQHQETTQSLIRPTSLFTVPAEVADCLDFVGGLTRFPRFSRHSPPVAATERVVSAAEVPHTTPATIKEAYGIDDVGSNSTGNLQSVVSFLEQYVNLTDLQVFQSTFELPLDPVAKILGPNDPLNPGIEASLDIQYLMGVATGVPTWIWSTAGNHDGDNEPFLKWLLDVELTRHIPYVFSISYQDREDTVESAYAERVCQQFMQTTLRGTTLVTGSGDWGTGCTDQCRRFQSDFPSSCPYAVSLGAVSWLSTPTGPSAATSWSSGGFSNYFAQPSWQSNVVNAYLNAPPTHPPTQPPPSYFNATGRGFPDLSTIGVDFQVMYGGKMIPVAGTSAATPTFAAMISLLNENRLHLGRPTMGHINPFLYIVPTYSSDAYVDVTRGTNKYGCCAAWFNAVPGWDPITGLGTPQYSVLRDLAMSTELFARFQ